jgi:hypothetical protein
MGWQDDDNVQTHVYLSTAGDFVELGTRTEYPFQSGGPYGTPLGWNEINTSGANSDVNRSVQLGRFNISIVGGTTPASGKYYGAYRDWPIQSGHTYIMRIQARTIDGRDSVWRRFMFDFMNSVGTIMGNGTSHWRTTSDWEDITIYLIAPSGSANLRVYLQADWYESNVANNPNWGMQYQNFSLTDQVTAQTEPTWKEVTCDITGFRSRYGRDKVTNRYEIGTLGLTVQNDDGEWTYQEPHPFGLRPGRFIRTTMTFDPIKDGYLDPTIGTVTTDDPGPIPPQCMFIMKIKGPTASGSSNTIASQTSTASGQYGWILRRDTANGRFLWSAYVAGDSVLPTTRSIPAMPVDPNAQTIALAIDTVSVPGQTIFTPWYKLGNQWFDMPPTQFATVIPFDSNAVMQIGGQGDTATLNPFKGLIYDVELRTGINPRHAGTTIWKFDASDFPGSATVPWSDPRGRKWSKLGVLGINGDILPTEYPFYYGIIDSLSDAYSLEGHTVKNVQCVDISSLLANATVPTTYSQDTVQPSDVRVFVLLISSGWLLSKWKGDSGVFQQQTPRSNGRTVRDEIALGAESEGGFLWTNPKGEIEFHNRDWKPSRTTTVQAELLATPYCTPPLKVVDTIANASGAPIVELQSIQTDWLRSRIINVLQLANQNGSAFQYRDNASAKKYGAITYQRTDLLNDNAHPEYLDLRAADLMTGFNEAILRVNSVTFRPDASNYKWVGQLWLNDLVRVRYELQRPDGSYWGWAMVTHVQGIEHALSVNDWQVTLNLDGIEAFNYWSTSSTGEGWDISSWDSTLWDGGAIAKWSQGSNWSDPKSIWGQ